MLLGNKVSILKLGDFVFWQEQQCFKNFDFGVILIGSESFFFLCSLLNGPLCSLLLACCQLGLQSLSNKTNPTFSPNLTFFLYQSLAIFKKAPSWQNTITLSKFSVRTRFFVPPYWPYDCVSMFESFQRALFSACWILIRFDLLLRIQARSLYLAYKWSLPFSDQILLPEHVVGLDACKIQEPSQVL